MTATNHALTGVAVTLVIKRPELALPLAFLSHFVIDGLPHWNYQLKFPLKKYVMSGDVLLGLLLSALATNFSQKMHVPAWQIFTGGFLAVFPDFMWLPYILTGKSSKTGGTSVLHLLRRFHFWIQWSETKQGLYVEAVWAVLMLGIIFDIQA